MKGFTKLGRTLLALTVLLVLPLSDALSQDFIMETTGATYNATCGAVIKLKGDSTGAGGIVTNNSNLLGSDVANAIPGVVDYAFNTADSTQIVQGLFFNSLFLSGLSLKDVADGVNIVGIACADFLTGYDELETYSYFAVDITKTTYNGTLTYNSDDPDSQTLFPDTYNNLALTGSGDKEIQAGDDVVVDRELTLASGSLLAIEGTILVDSTSTLAGNVGINSNGEFNVGDSLITFDGTITMTGGELNGGAGGLVANSTVTLNAADTSTVNVNVGAGDITFSSTSTLTLTDGSIIAADDVDGTVFIAGDATLETAGELDFGANTFLEISGTIANNGDGLNLLFACSSTVTYNGGDGQLVMPTVSTNSYGNLLLDSGSKTMTTLASPSGWDVYLCGDFTLNGGGNFDIFKGDENPGTLFMTGVTKSANYANNEEVVGSFSRATDDTARVYTFNNAKTVLSLAANEDNPTEFETFVLPGSEVITGFEPNGYDSDTDVNRKITVTHNAAADFDMTLKVGYLFSERIDWTDPNTQASIRMYEGDIADNIEKIGTGETPVRVAASGDTLGSIELEGIGYTATTSVDPSNGIGLFASTNDVVLRAGPTTFYSINPGRWTNPNTWDEGTYPSENDNAEIRHMVYVGIPGPFAGTLEANNTTTEASTYVTGDNAAANKITISGEAQFAANTPSLVIGNLDNGNYVFKTKQTTGTTFVNNNTAAPATAFNATDGILSAYATKGDVNIPNAFNGLWLVGFTGGPDDGIPHFKTNQIENSGSINNEGIIEVGQ